MEGFLGKKGKRMGSRVKRYMRLDGVLLSNHHDASSTATWRVNLKDATISSNPKRLKIVIELYNNKLELYAESSRECKEWYDALCKAKKAAVNERAEGKENGAVNINESEETANMTSESSVVVDKSESAVARETSDWGSKFKVVKPQPSVVMSDNSSGSDEAYDGSNPLVVQGQIYEETPASMIFKQFNFPEKQR